MVQDEQTKMQVDIGVLKEQTKTLTEICNKMDTIISKIIDNEDKWIQRIYSDMEKKENILSQEISITETKLFELKKELSDKFELSENKIMAEIRSIRSDFLSQKQSNKDSMEKLLEWKYMIVGGIITFGWIITHLDLTAISKLFH